MARQSAKTDTLPPEAPQMEGAPKGPDLRTPMEWAIAKGYVRFRRKGLIDYRAPKAHLLRCAYIVRKNWPDPQLDPTFRVTEEDFDNAVKEVI